ncbi:unnamed protein product [Hymenolepis diminuta]|uniref:Uncharacterized protein n=1 Tax=Hymenolepis diminuta TaxID=6216 RepID=A0A564YKL6_HYMDI|nr:unnamed protein product [Hymenolepis diminuta]
MKIMNQFTKYMNLNSGQSENFLFILFPYNFVLQISEFHHGPERGFTFNNWPDKCKDVFRKTWPTSLRRKELELDGRSRI